MGISIGDAILYLSTDNKGMYKGLKAAEKRTEETAKKVSKYSDSMGIGLQRSFSKVTEAIAGYASIRSIQSTMSKWSQMGDSLDEMSQRTGVGVSMLSKLSYAASLSGSNLEGLEGAVRKMQKGIEGSDKSFQKLGLDVVALRSLGVEQQFITTLEALSRIPDATARSAVAMGVFGKTGTSLLPMISGGMAAFNEQLEKAQKMGAVWSPEQASAAAQYADSVDNLGTAFRALSNAAASQLAPSLTRILNLATEMFNKVREKEEKGDSGGWNPARGWAWFLENVANTPSAISGSKKMGLGLTDIFGSGGGAKIPQLDRELSDAKLRNQGKLPLDIHSAVLGIQAQAGKQKANTQSLRDLVGVGPSNLTVNNITVSHANIAMGEKQKAAYNLKRSMMPGVP